MARAVLLTLLLSGAVAAGESETPPAGPPWQRDLLAARAEALAAGKPLFLYFTKTY